MLKGGGSDDLAALHDFAHPPLNGQFVERRIAGKRRHLVAIDLPGCIGIDEDQIGLATDFNTADISPSGNIHGMSLACLTGHGHADLTGFAGRVPAVNPAYVALVGVRDLDPGERQALRDSGVRCFTMQDIDRRGFSAVMEDAVRIASQAVDGFHVSFDLDVIDPREAPGVGTPVPGGISYREAHLAMEFIAVSGRMVSIDLVEDNPVLDDRNKTALLGVELIQSAFGKQIL